MPIIEYHRRLGKHDLTFSFLHSDSSNNKISSTTKDINNNRNLLQIRDNIRNVSQCDV